MGALNKARLALVGLLAILSLSEVIIGFSWSTLFSKTAGITNLFVALGLMSEPVSLSPSFGAAAARAFERVRIRGM